MNDNIFNYGFCGYKKQRYKEDCYFYERLQDMNAWVPWCGHLHTTLCDECDVCNFYISKEKANEIIKRCINLGGKFYVIYFDEIVEKELYEIRITKNGELCVSDGDGCVYPVDQYGDNVRFTREEAESRQKELYGE